MSERVKVKPDILRKKLSLWINRGFIHEVTIQIGGE